MANFPTVDEVTAIRVALGNRTSDEIFQSFREDEEVVEQRTEDVTPTAAATFRADGCFTSAHEALAFLSAGNATATLVSKTSGARFTYKVRKPEDGDGTFLFVSVLNGPDNWQNYAYFGYIRRGVFFHGRAKAKVIETAPSVKAFAWAWGHLSRGDLPETLEVWHEGKCGRCGRKLTVPTSIASGFGPECAGRV